MPEGVLVQPPAPTSPAPPRDSLTLWPGSQRRPETVTVQEHLPLATGNHDQAHGTRALCPWTDRATG